MNAEARQVLAELELLSHGSVARWNASGGGSEAVMPPGESSPPHLYWAELFARCEIDKLPGLVVQARAELESLKRRVQPLPESSVSVDEMVIEEGRGHAVSQVAQRFGLSPAHVYRIRRRAGVDPDTGEGADPGDRMLSRGERRARSRELHAQGMTLRQIASILGVDHKTVSADLRDAA